MIRKTKPLLLIILACLALPGLAQVYTWKDESGRTIMSDKPPPGKKKIERPSADEGAAAPAPAATAKPGIDPEIEKRKKEQADKKQAEKAQKDKIAADENKVACEQIQRNIASLESGTRIALVDDKGERYYMDDEKRASEISRYKAMQAKAGCQ